MITLIAAIGTNNELGKNNDLIWHLPADLKRFKTKTSGHSIIMGRNTFESIGRPLPNRITIIITRNKAYKQDGCIVVHSLEEAIGAASKDKELFLIGGAQIYNEAIQKNLVDILDITHVHESFQADVFFPEIDVNRWCETTREDIAKDEKNIFDYSFVTYQKRD